MEGYDYATYGDRFAEIYDRSYEGVFAETDATVDFLASLIDGGRVLELAIGTGRVALPLSARGVEIEGIDASRAMVEKLVAKPGGQAIPVTIGNFADVDRAGPFALVFIVFNTFFSLLTQDEQIRCFENVASRLAEGGAFVIEAFVPDLGRFDREQRVEVQRIDLDELTLLVSHHDAAGQRIDSQHIVVSDSGNRFYPIRIRYAWPSELDLMGRLAGLTLRERWGGWRREPFTSASVRHVSVYERASASYL